MDRRPDGARSEGWPLHGLGGDAGQTTRNHRVSWKSTGDRVAARGESPTPGALSGVHRSRVSAADDPWGCPARQPPGEPARPARRACSPTHGVDGREGRRPRQQTNRGRAVRVDLPAPEPRAAQDRVAGEGDHRRRRQEADLPDPRHGVALEKPQGVSGMARSHEKAFR